MQRRIRLGVLISGNGSNLQAIIDACTQPDFPAQVVRVISDQPDAYGLQRATAAQITHSVCERDAYPSRQAMEEDMTRLLEQGSVELICLAGYMRVLSREFVQRWHNRLINIHPSLLPAYKGLHTHKQAIEDGVRISGCTVHLVRPDVDSGPILMQAAVPVLPDDTVDTLQQRVHAAEHIIYPATIRYLGNGTITLDGNKVRWTQPIQQLEPIMYPLILSDQLGISAHGWRLRGC